MSVQSVPVRISARSATIQIKNQTNNYKLINHRVIFSKGKVYDEPASVIEPKQSKVCSFIKTNGTACGTSAVLTYQLYNQERSVCNDMLAIMFSVPQDNTLYSNWFAVGIFSVNDARISDLFNEMYYNSEYGFVRRRAGNQINYNGRNFNVKASMSDVGSSVLTVELS